jgi:hypothetical protein
VGFSPTRWKGPMKIPNFIRSGRLMFVYAPFISYGKIAVDPVSILQRWGNSAIIVLLHTKEQPASGSFNSRPVGEVGV